MEAHQGGGGMQQPYGGDFRPDTAAAIRAVQQAEGQGMHGGPSTDFRPDTAAAIAAVQQQFG